MPALKPLPSLARIEANRQNAARSTGPRTDAGKARSRANAVRHGLTGAGIALPTEDEALVVERFAALRDQLRPATPLGEYHVGRIALGIVRVERAARHEAAALAFRVRHAAEDFEIARAAEADSALDRLRLGEGRAARRALLRTPEGIDRLLAELAGLRGGLTLTDPLWSHNHGARLDACLGVAVDPLIPSRVAALTSPILGEDGDLLTRRDLAAIAEAQATPAEYALRQLLALIDAEAAALRADLAAIDPATIEADRVEATARALFDPSPTAQLARRYEAAAARAVDRSVSLFREVEGPASGPEPLSTAAESQPIVAVPEQPTPATLDPAPQAPARVAPEDATGETVGRIEESATIGRNPLPGHDLDARMASFGPDRLTADKAMNSKASWPVSASLTPSSPAIGGALAPGGADLLHPVQSFQVGGDGMSSAGRPDLIR